MSNLESGVCFHLKRKADGGKDYVYYKKAKDGTFDYYLKSGVPVSASPSAVSPSIHLSSASILSAPRTQPLPPSSPPSTQDSNSFACTD